VELGPIRYADIPALAAYGLSRVPGAVNSTDDYWRGQYFPWKDTIITLRDRVHDMAEGDAAFREEEMRLCAADPAYWLAMYGWIEEPRTTPDEETIKPFIPFEFQVRLLQEFVRTVEQPYARDLYISKARGLGASWLLCAAAYWAWLFRPWRGKLVSRNEKLVDAPLDLDSLFGKIDFLIHWTPKWMLPAGYQRKEHRRELMLQNPSTGAAISGESTTSQAMRGARSTYSIYDEAAFIRNFSEVWATGESTTTHRIGVSTESFSVGYDWWDTWNLIKKEGDPTTVIELEWWENTYQDQQWFQRAEARSLGQIEKFRREYLRNPYEGSGQFIYEIARNLPERFLAFDPVMPLYISIDPGHADDTAIVWAQDHDDEGHAGLSFLGSYERNYAPVEWYAHLLTGIRPEEQDLCFGMEMSEYEEHLFLFFHNLPWSNDRVMVFMDPAGAQRHAGISFWDIFTEKTFELRKRVHERKADLDLPNVGPPTPIVPEYQALKKFSQSFHEERRNATRPILMHSVVDKSLWGVRIKTCLVNYRMSELTDKSTSESKPIHGKGSHIVTAVEYLCSYMQMGFIGWGSRTAAPYQRRGLGYMEREDDGWSEPGLI
jgi:hypothetical protein